MPQLVFSDSATDIQRGLQCIWERGEVGRTPLPPTYLCCSTFSIPSWDYCLLCYCSYHPDDECQWTKRCYQPCSWLNLRLNSLSKRAVKLLQYHSYIPSVPAKIGPVCIDCCLSDLVGKIFKIWLEMWKQMEKKHFYPNFVNNRLQLYIMVFLFTSCQCCWHIFFFYWLKNVILKCFHEIKYIRNVRISFLFGNWPCESSYLAWCVFTFTQFQVFL